ncbi:M15 family metallopeptidase [Polaribacter tangerinus]|uniref:M15 family metallopeptidase n=1 Tax=Polaribacter tangerinus TaxID=1920034 RepID=UPI000B4B34B0|nr:M15 family metallopeptidase [Polaribacter tangerinus]
MKNLILILILIFSQSLTAQNLPKEFVYLQDIDNSIVVELRYFTSNNFTGKPVNGYNANCLIISKKAALGLKKVQKELLKKGMSIKIFDAYRPQKAVDHFISWAKKLNDTLAKKSYYPKVKKNNLFKLGYIASKSGHSRGSTVDLTIINIDTKQELDMGSSYDFFGEESHPFYPKITVKQQKNRNLLRAVMVKNGFIPYNKEWWHFTLKNEPFPKTYFDFNVE